MSLNYFVYCYYDLNDIPIYVGMGKNERHLSHLKIVQSGGKLKNPRFEHKIKQILQNDKLPRIEKLHEGLSLRHAKELEIDYIAKYGRLDLNRGTLYNLTRGGDGLCEWSDEQRKNMSNKRKNKINAKDANGKKFIVEDTDPRWLNGELVGQNSGIKFSDTSAFTGFVQSRNVLTGEIARLRIGDDRLNDPNWVGVNKGVVLADDVRAKISESVKAYIAQNPRGKKCTIDGIEIFDSHKDLCTKYGRGKKGALHPNFRYV